MKTPHRPNRPTSKERLTRRDLLGLGSAPASVANLRTVIRGAHLYQPNTIGLAERDVLQQIGIRRLYISPGHNFFGHHGQPADHHPTVEVPAIECVAGRGVRGDRFIDYKDNYKGQITFFAWEAYEGICAHFSVRNLSPSVFRRNVITMGADLNSLIGQEFEIQGVRFRGTEECRPCHWMNSVFADGAEDYLRGQGGLRAVILTPGILRANLP